MYARVFMVAVVASGCGAGFAGMQPVGAAAGQVDSRYEGEPLAAGELDEGAAASLVVVPASPSRYTVQPGETLWRIAKNHGVTLEVLAQANGIKDPTAVRAGTVLTIPGKAAPAPIVASTAPKPAAAATSTVRYPLTWPIDGQVTSRFGRRDGRSHDGIDIGAPNGTSVHAAAPGEVVFAARHGGYGNLVVLRHDNGLVTVYAHHSSILVRKGQRVTAGQIIAKVGDTGRATGPHLHFEVRQGVAPQNPLRFLPP